MGAPQRIECLNWLALIEAVSTLMNWRYRGERYSACRQPRGFTIFDVHELGMFHQQSAVTLQGYRRDLMLIYSPAP